MATKFYPEVGTKLYLSQRTGNYYVDMVKTPYTVIGVASGKVLVHAQRGQCVSAIGKVLPRKIYFGYFFLAFFYCGKLIIVGS